MSSGHGPLEAPAPGLHRCNTVVGGLEIDDFFVDLSESTAKTITVINSKGQVTDSYILREGSKLIVISAVTLKAGDDLVDKG